VADEPTTTAKAEFWWGAVLASAREHETTAELWQRINDQAASQGVSLPSDIFSQVNRMRGLASGLAYSSELLGRSGNSDAITSGVIGEQIYKRSEADLSELATRYHVRFELTTYSSLGESTDWRTLDYGGSLPGTVGELRDDVEAYAQGLSDSYGAEFGNVGTIEIGAY
jgi:hypothetical protein